VVRKPRLLVLITLAEAGGAQESVSLLLPALAERFDVTLAAHGSGPLSESAREAGVPFVELRHVRRPIQPWHDVLGLIELFRLCRRLRPDIVHAHSSKAGALGRLAAALAGVPIRVFTVHGWAFGAYGGLQGRCYLWLERWLSRLTTSVVCVAVAVRELGLAAGACEPGGQTVVIHNAVDVTAFPEFRPGPGPPRVISVGRFAFPKDFESLASAFARLSADYRAVLAGDGPDLPQMRAALDQHGLLSRVELLGARRDVHDLLATSDVFVLSSRSEGFPVSILEAMAAGLPVVASDVGGVAEAVVHGETGLLVPAGDAAALAGALERLLADAALRSRFGERGRERARRHFDVKTFRLAHLELYARELERLGLPVSAAAEPGEWRPRAPGVSSIAIEPVQEGRTTRR
jgi:glycosyltransferase involved in cell wall biosynthesis